MIALSLASSAPVPKISKLTCGRLSLALTTALTSQSTCFSLAKREAVMIENGLRSPSGSLSLSTLPTGIVTILGVNGVYLLN